MLQLEQSALSAAVLNAFTQPTSKSTQTEVLRVQPSPKASRYAIITVIGDHNHTLGKKFTVNPDGTVSKSASVNVSSGFAKMHLVETFKQLAALLEIVGKDPRAAIINASFDDIEVGERFLILSAKELEERTGIPATDRERQKGVHLVNYNGKCYKAVCRFKENAKPSCWQLFDRDVDQYTPTHLAEMNLEQWVQAVGKMVLGFADVTYCHVASTSSRVLKNGKPVGGGNGHVWVKFDNPEDLERFRTAVMISAAQVGMTWLKRRHSHKEPGNVVGQSLCSIIDPSVFSVGRLTFVGKPVVDDGLTVLPLTAVIHTGTTDTLDTTATVLPAEDVVREVTRKAGAEMEVRCNGTGLRISANDLTLDTEIQTKDYGIKTVRELLALGIQGKIRCQTPFRDSSSYAAFLSVNADGKPFIYDSGTSITHWLNEFDADGLELLVAADVVQRALAQTKDDCGAPFVPETVKALAVIKSKDEAQYRRMRADFKRANKEVSAPALDSAIKAQKSGAQVVATHHGYASELLKTLTNVDCPPVSHEGRLFVVDPECALWNGVSMDQLERMVAQSFDGKDNCERRADYNGIAQHAIILASDEAFFSNPPIGLACPGGFYQVKDNAITAVPLTPAHRQRVMLAVTPQPMETPLFLSFLQATFHSDRPDEAVQQIALVQELAGAIALGILHRYQIAIQFYDPFGRAGKGTLERILRALVPASFVTAVSPFVWDKEYYLASLVGARLNVVGELPDGDAIPAAAFKTVIGGDLLTGRHPTHRPISFKNEAAHLFMSNHMINSRDHSEAFFARWKLVEFPNSLLRSGLPQDHTLPERIIAQELPGIVQWALDGAVRLIANGGFSKSAAHDRLMAQWRRSTNSVEEFIHECCVLGQEHSAIRSQFYQAYTLWCHESGRKAFSKSRVKELLDHNVGVGISLVRIDGYETFRGVMVKPDFDALV